VVSEIKAKLPGANLGIHAHNDTEQAVAVSLAAVRGGARQIQGTLNGLGERCGNANLCSLLPNLMLKEPYASQFETGVSSENLARLTSVSRLLDEILNRAPDRYAPYVGPSAFVHKGGLHSSAVLKNPATYEHVKPESVGNERIIPVSDQAGRSNVMARLAEAGITLDLCRFGGRQTGGSRQLDGIIADFAHTLHRCREIGGSFGEVSQRVELNGDLFGFHIVFGVFVGFDQWYLAASVRPCFALCTARSMMWMGRRDHSGVMTSLVPLVRWSAMF
jgi:hypothetical protein